MNIQLSNISKSYKENSQKRIIFDSTSINFPPGKLSVVMGKSGVGKSSLLNLISGIDLPDSGDISIGSVQVSRMSDTQRTLFRRRHIGFVFQSFHLVPSLTALENVMLPLELADEPDLPCSCRSGHT